MTLPHPALIVLRSVVTLLLSAVIGQAGWAAALLGGEVRYRTFHEVGALVTVALGVVTAVVYIVLRRYGGAVSTTLAILLAAALGVQWWLGHAGIVSEHIFGGVLVAMLATALTSWTYRHVYVPEQDRLRG